MKTKAIIASAVVLALLIFIVMFFTDYHGPTQAVTVRHVKSVQSGDITTMTFEITNHTAHTYIFQPVEVQVRNGDSWTTFQNIFKSIGPGNTLTPCGVASYAVSVTNLPAKSVVRLGIRSHKMLLGVEGFVKRAKMKQKFRGLSWDPFDTSIQVYGDTFYILSDEWVETVVP
jgi:hypothetical protein